MEKPIKEFNDKDWFDFHKKIGAIGISHAERVEYLTDQLLQCLFSPSNKSKFVPDFDKIVSLGIDKGEPINWGDISSTVETKGDVFIITLQEALPGCCPTLCEYIKSYMTAWGWDVEVKTEW